MEDIVFLEGFQIFRVSENPWHTQAAPLSRGILRAFQAITSMVTSQCFGGQYQPLSVKLTVLALGYRK